MTLDITRYRQVNLPLTKKWIEVKGMEDLEQALSEIAISTGCPVIAVCHFIGELYGWTPELTTSLERKMTFYRYQKVVG